MKTIKEIIKQGCTASDGGCWTWNGYVRGSYPCITIRKTHYQTHRLSYEAWHGDIPTGLVVRHKCDNQRCVNPEHLEVGTHEDNARDRDERGRHNPAFGENNGASKLTNSERDEVLRLAKTGVKHSTLAEKYNVSRTTISRLCRVNGQHNNPRKLTEQQKRLILELRNDGVPRQDIANKLNIAKSTVGYYIWKSNK